jgi:hypothetical protein
VGPVDAVGQASYVLIWFKRVQTSLIQKKENRKNAPLLCLKEKKELEK